MFINLQPNVTFRQGYSFSTCSGRTRYPCSYFIFAIKNIIGLFFLFNGKTCYKSSTKYWSKVSFNV